MDSDESTGWSPDDGYGEPEPPPLDSGGGDSLSDPDLAYGGDDDSDGLGSDAPEGDPDAPEGDAGEPLTDSASSDTEYGIDPNVEADPDGGPGVSDEPADTADGDGDASDTAADAPPGVDPDADPVADDEAWSHDPFPESLDLDAPEPVDGMPWTDPATLGGGEDQLGSPTADSGPAPVSDLYAYD
ncbi:MAG: hypothetical protein ACRDT8_17445, partial [Micromonosporaceae bacterium]